MTQAELVSMAETLATSNARLHVELARARAENARLRRSRANAQLRGDRRIIEGAVQDAKWLGVLHVAGLNTSRRAKDVHGLSRHRHESAIAILRLGRLYGAKGWRVTCPAEITEGIEAGRNRAISDITRWRGRLPQYRVLG